MKNPFGPALRSLLRRPGFTVLILTILALCIGGNASVFSVANAVLYQDLQYQESDRLGVLMQVYLPNGNTNDLSWVEIEDWQQRAQSFEALEPFLCWQHRLAGEGESLERIGVSYVTPGYQRLLGVEPQIGRWFSDSESGAPGIAPAVIVSSALWKRRFGGDPGVLGQDLLLNGSSYTVIGVMPEGFVDIGEDRWEVDAWLPATMAGESFGDGPGIYEGRDHRYWFALAKLAPGVSWQEAQQEVDAIAELVQEEHPESNRDFGAVVEPVRDFIFGDLKGGMSLLLVGALLVLLLGCANIANLLSVRNAERRGESILHLILGSSRRQLIVRVLTESLILAAVGGVLGLLLTFGGTRLLTSLVELPEAAQVAVDGRVVLVLVVAALATGVLFTLPSILAMLRLVVRGELLRGGGGARGYSGSKSRSRLLVVQVAVVAVLLIAAGLLLRSFHSLRSADVGFAAQELLTLRMSFESDRYQERGQIPAVQRELAERLSSLPGVDGVTFWGPNIPGISTRYMDLQREGAEEDAPSVRADAHVIIPGALPVMDIALLRGRSFGETDRAEDPRAVLITESLGDTLWPGEDPLGKRLTRVGRDGEPWNTVVGVIENVRLQGRFDEGNHHVLFAADQLPVPSSTLIVRTAAGAEAIVPSLRKEVLAADPLTPVYDISTLRERFWKQEASHRLNAVVVALYTILALIFALLGLYGMLSYTVIQRTREIGVRVAMGAEPNNILGLVMSRGLGILAAGLVLGVGLALLLTEYLESLLYGVESRDPATFVVVVVGFLIVGVLASWLPAYRALRISPTRALRYE